MSLKLYKGIFINELPNRFLCNVIIYGKTEKCYLPFNTKLNKYFILNKNEVLLKNIKKKKSKTRYSIFAIKINNHYVLVNLSYANFLLYSNLMSKTFSFLGERSIFKKEYYILPNYKTDIFIPETKTIIEVKTVIGFTETVLFPIEYSERFYNQLQSIFSMLKRGYRACIFICILTSVATLDFNTVASI